jgi:hypothetical protein
MHGNVECGMTESASVRSHALEISWMSAGSLTIHSRGSRHIVDGRVYLGNGGGQGFCGEN